MDVGRAIGGCSGWASRSGLEAIAVLRDPGVGFAGSRSTMFASSGVEVIRSAGSSWQHNKARSASHFRVDAGGKRSWRTAGGRQAPFGRPPGLRGCAPEKAIGSGQKREGDEWERGITDSIKEGLARIRLLATESSS